MRWCWLLALAGCGRFGFASPIPAVTPPQTGGTFDLGAVTDNEGSDTGTVDEVSIYSRALTVAEIQLLLAR